MSNIPICIKINRLAVEMSSKGSNKESQQRRSGCPLITDYTVIIWHGTRIHYLAIGRVWPYKTSSTVQFR